MDPEQWRSQMGEGLGGWFDGPELVYELTDTSWTLLSGAPSPDMNMRLVWGEDPAEVTAAMTDIDDRQLAALVLLAGPAKAHATSTPEGWEHVGAMPIMQVGLAAAEATPDPRVRQAGPQDLDTVTGLVADAFGLEPAIAKVSAQLVESSSEQMQFWLLEDEGQAVSTVMTSFAGNTVSVWCMSTPSRFARKGYGRALLAAVLDGARGRGAQVGLLGATPAGQPLYEATGWTTFETWDIFTNAASAQFS